MLARTFPLLAALPLLAAPAVAQHVLRTFTGDQAGAHFGATLAMVNDTDGDGVRDLVIGEPLRDIGPMPDSGAVVLLSTRTGTIRFRSTSGYVLGELGTSVAGLGDVDGDGVPDWAAGAPTVLSSSGMARVLSGATGAVLFERLGQPASRFGAALCNAGDCNADGHADVAISSPNNSSSLPYGAVRIYSSNGTQQSQLAGGSQTCFGFALATLGDLEGDGQSEIAISEPLLAFNGTDSGRVVALNGRQSGPRSVVWHVEAPFGANTRAGWNLANAGDYNGDGKSDVVALGQLGQIYVLSGQNGAVLLHTTNPYIGGISPAAGIGDFDGDGVDDFAIGAPAAYNNAGVVFVYAGGTGATLAVLMGAAGSNFGASLAGVGDIDGDGRADLAVGAPRTSVNAQVLGTVTVHGFDIQALAQNFGSGCAGTAGVPDVYTNNAPLRGATIDVVCQHLIPLQPSCWLFGLSNMTFGAVPLPIDLGALGMTGCALLTSSDLVEPFLSVSQWNAGWGRRTFALPGAPGFVGLSFYAQACQVDPQGPGGLTFSNGLQLRIGNY